MMPPAMARRTCEDCGQWSTRKRCPRCGGFTRLADEQWSSMEIVGESKYQPALRTMLARDGRSTTIRLEPEPENPHDANAIKVCDVATGATVGYIPRENAARYQAAAGTLAGEPLAAELVGGTGTKPSIGVYFNGRRLKDAVGEKPASVAGLGCGCLLILLLGLIALVAVVGLISDS